MRIKELQSFALFWTHRARNQNLFFGEPPPLVDDSKNIWVAQFHHAYRAYCAYNQQILYKGRLVEFPLQTPVSECESN